MFGTKGSLTNLAQRGPQFLIDVTDKEGRAWKIDTVETPKATTSFVIDSTGKVVLTAAVFADSTGRRKSLVFVDSAQKEDALAILDKRFLSDVAHQSDAYRKWFDKYAVFSYGSTEKTESFDVSRGLGSSTVHGEGATIVGQIKDAKCHCQEMGLTCVVLPSPMIACLNKFCDLVNCVIGVINGSGSDCQQEGIDAKQTCEIAVGQPQ